MEFKKEMPRQVRFQEATQNFEDFCETDERRHEKKLPLYKSPAILRNSEGGYIADKISKIGRSKVFPEGQEPGKKTVLDPGSETVLKWNRMFMFSCLVALFVDPLFFYLPSFRTAYVSPSSRVFGKGELVVDLDMIAAQYLKSEFFIDFIAMLPLPQIVIWSILPAIRSSSSDHTNSALLLVILLQYIPRLYLIFPLSSRIIKATGVVTKTAWAGAAYNLLLYMLASHVLGASWYLLSIERHATCWKSACRTEFNSTRCSPSFMDCGALSRQDRTEWIKNTLVFARCRPDNTTFFNYGIFGNAVANNVVSSKFLEKFFYCLWWGLQNLSSYGQTLSTSTFIGETLFAILIAILGLILFAHLIGNMQTYLQSLTVRLEEWRLKQRDTEEWMRHRQLPEALQQRVRRFTQYKWLTTRGVNEEIILRALPGDLSRDIQRHLCLDLVRRVPFFSQMDDQLLDAICARLVSSLSTEGTYIVREGDPVTEMLFIIRGTLDSSTTNGGRAGFFNLTALRPGDFCGEELLAWALLPKSTLNLPSSTRTVKALSEVEAFALTAEDLKYVANQFRRLHSKKLQHTFRYYSHHWRTWAATFIQAAWRRHKKRMMSKSLSMMESFNSYNSEELVECNDDEESRTRARQGLGVTVLASRFAANTRKGARRSKNVKLPKLQKPEEPDFSADPDND
ncbi:probable cyclic nucleotide-gated ion channel 14 isoform X2 [Andrographis paniculata]|uniref:probable cyclic nucleotide-gated ion channel 14 isoform X2 n=1 Tax=Andrographis paniculata TaxID=175694 RepID=UPI0021E738A2|nr:probable cyclic nucleotide-gated ion channel 14 isoform X2 [Andrographis paniculata]